MPKDTLTTLPQVYKCNEEYIIFILKLCTPIVAWTMLAKLLNNYLFINKLLGEGGGGFDFVDGGGGGDSGIHPEPEHNNDPKRKKTTTACTLYTSRTAKWVTKF